MLCHVSRDISKNSFPCPTPSFIQKTGRQVADYSGGLDFLDEILQKVYLGFGSRRSCFERFIILVIWDGKTKMSLVCLIDFNMLHFVYPRFSQMNIRDPQARIFMNFYADGKDKIAAHRHDFWTCLLLPQAAFCSYSWFFGVKLFTVSLVSYLPMVFLHRGCPLVRIVFWRWTAGQCCCEMAIWSFLVLKIMECQLCGDAEIGWSSEDGWSTKYR